MASPQRQIHAVPHKGDESESALQENIQAPFWHQWFAPHKETQMVSQQSKGLFLPYPLLAILTTVGILLVSGIIALQVQVSNLNTTLLLRDADYREQQRQSWEKIEQAMVYIQNDRERLARLEAERDAKRR